MRYAALLLLFSIGLGTPTLGTTAIASSPTGWSPVVLPTGSYRTQIKSMPIKHRPGRLLHFYGNSIRMIDQTRRGHSVRPLRQVFIGTPELPGRPRGQ